MMLNEFPASLQEHVHGNLLPSQFYDLTRRSEVLSGELKLFVAVLEDAITCYLKNMGCLTPEQREQFFEVESWLKEEPVPGAGPQNLFAYRTMCESLGIDAESLRRWLVGLRASGVSAMRRPRRVSRVVSYRRQRIGSQGRSRPVKIAAHGLKAVK
jgi:hypothetical protein